MNEFVPDDSIEPLPFGLSLKKNISPAHAKKAVSWLRQISGYLGDNGFIKDNIGVRGYDPGKINYFLSTAAREYTQTILRAKIRAAEARTVELGDWSSEQQEITSKLEAQKVDLDKLLSKLSELTEKNARLEKEFETYRKKEENLLTEEAKYRGSQEIIVSVRDVFKEAYNGQNPALSFEIDEILVRANELIEQIELFESYHAKKQFA